jgi:hypothetical protein
MIRIECNCYKCEKLITDVAYGTYGNGVITAKTYCHTCYIELIEKIKELEQEIEGYKRYFLLGD